MNINTLSMMISVYLSIARVLSFSSDWSLEFDYNTYIDKINYLNYIGQI